MNSLSLDKVLKAPDGAGNMKQQTGENNKVFEAIEQLYLIHEELLTYFAGVEKQFSRLKAAENISAKIIDAFTVTFEQHSKSLASLKFKISRIKPHLSDESYELQDFIRYCRQEMILQEAESCLEELEKLQHSEELRKQEKQKQQEVLERLEELKQHEEARRLEELKQHEEAARLEEDRKKREGWLIANSDGTVSDSRTGLMWAAKDNGHEIEWERAKNYCKNYRLGEYTDWRMPTVNELLGLYHAGSAGYTTAFITLSSYFLWASDTDSSASDKAAVIFALGGRRRTHMDGPGGSRVLPVRLSK